MTQIATKMDPHFYPQTYKEGGNDANSDKILALALPQKCKQGGNDTNSDKICSPRPSQAMRRGRE